MLQTARSLTFLDQSGDTTIVWDETTDEKMLKIIEDRMAKGYRFFILKPNPIPFLPARKVRAKTITEVKNAASVVIMDDDLNSLFVNGDIRTMKANDNLETVRSSRNAVEVSTSQSVAVKPARGG